MNQNRNRLHSRQNTSNSEWYDNESNASIEEIEVSLKKRVRFTLADIAQKKTQKRINHGDLIEDKYEFKKPSFAVSL